MQENFDWWYYSLSAVAQVAAAILALGGAIIVFQLERIRRGTISYRDRIIKYVLITYWRLKATHKTDINYYDVSDESVYKEAEGFLTDIKNDIDTKKSTSNYFLRISSSFPPMHESEAWPWIMGTLRSLKINIEAEKYIFLNFKRIILILTLIIVVSLFLLSFISPNEKYSPLLFAWLLLLMLIGICITTRLFWKMLKQKVISY